MVLVRLLSFYEVVSKASRHMPRDSALYSSAAYVAMEVFNES